MDMVLWSDLVRDGDEAMLHTFLRRGRKRMHNPGHKVAYDELQRIMKDPKHVASFRDPDDVIETGPQKMKRLRDEKAGRSVVMEVQKADDPMFDLDILETQDMHGGPVADLDNLFDADLKEDDDDETHCSEISDD
jgi:hypothetical protein